MAGTDDLTLFKYGAVAVCYILTLLAGLVAFKMMTWQGKRKKMIRTGSRLFAAGVCLGTAMMDLVRDADVTFLGHRVRYPLAFLLSCTGYAVAMLSDCLLARLVKSLGRDCKRDPNLLDKIMLSFVSKVHPIPIRCCDTTLVVISTSLAKDCDNIGAQTRDLLFHRLTVLGDSIVVAVTFGLLCMPGGNNIWNANTTTMVSSAFVSAIVQNIVYAATLVFTLLRTIQIIPYIQSLLFLLGTGGTLYSFTFNLFVLSENKELVGGSWAIEWAWYKGFFSGFFSGSLVYIAVHHLLLESSHPKNRLWKIMLMLFGIGIVGVLNILAN